MVELTPVRAWHPDPAAVDPDDVVCPVYDTLSDSEFAQYASRPFNAARFVPRARGVELAAFLLQASAALSTAIRSGAYIQDPRPSFYIYGIRYVPPSDVLETLEPQDRRPEYLLLGLVGTVDFGLLEHGQIALHERTFSDRVAERVALTDATGMSFAPILTGYHGPDHHLNDRLEGILGLRRSHLSFEGTVPPVVKANLGATTHLLWRIDDPRATAEIREEVRLTRNDVRRVEHRGV